MILETLVAAFGLTVLGGIYLTLAPADREAGDCGSCSLEEDPTLCGGCGLPETPPPDAERAVGEDRGLDWRAPGDPRPTDGWSDDVWREEAP